MTKTNEIEFITEDIIKVYTTQGYFICDYEDWKKYNCENITWRLMRDSTYDDSDYYAHGQPRGIGLLNNSKDRPVIAFHRYITEAELKEEVDHQNGCTLDNRRKNLRKCNRKDNSKNLKLSKNNTSGHKGVDWSKKNNKWRARIRKDNKEINLGMFVNYEDAVKAREEAEEKIYGDFSAKKSRGIKYEDIPPTIDEIIQNILKEVN